MSNDNEANQLDFDAQRRDCLHKCREGALAEELPLEANAKLLNCDLMSIAGLMARKIEKGIEAGEMANVLPVIELLTKVSRESEKWARFTTRYEQPELRGRYPK